jgi:glucose-1-phosphate thymidylyltransferase
MRRDEHDVALTASQAAAADLGVKSMIPVGRPFLDHVLSALADGGIRAICIVVNADDHLIRDRYMRDVIPQRLGVTFAVQRSPTGTAHAILAARSFAGTDSFIVLNGDNLYPAPAVSAMCVGEAPAIAAFRAAALVRRGNIPAERLRAFAVIETDEQGTLRDIIEKPGADVRIDDDTLISMNLWAFAPEIFTVCEQTPPSSRGEFELAGAVRDAIRGGTGFRVVKLDEGVLDLTERRDIPAVTSRLESATVSL